MVEMYPGRHMEQKKMHGIPRLKKGNEKREKNKKEERKKKHAVLLLENQTVVVANRLIFNFADRSHRLRPSIPFDPLSIVRSLLSSVKRDRLGRSTAARQPSEYTIGETIDR